MTLGCVLLLNFWKSLRSIGIINSSLLGRIPLWSYPVLDFCLQGVFIFNMIDSISLLVTSLFILPMSSWLSFGRLYVSRDLSTSSRLSNLFFLIFSYEFLYFCGINCYFSSLISYFVYLTTRVPCCHLLNLMWWNTLLWFYFTYSPSYLKIELCYCRSLTLWIFLSYKILSYIYIYICIIIHFWWDWFL